MYVHKSFYPPSSFPSYESFVVKKGQARQEVGGHISGQFLFFLSLSLLPIYWLTFDLNDSWPFSRPLYFTSTTTATTILLQFFPSSFPPSLPPSLPPFLHSCNIQYIPLPPPTHHPPPKASSNANKDAHTTSAHPSDPPGCGSNTP